MQMMTQHRIESCRISGKPAHYMTTTQPHNPRSWLHGQCGKRWTDTGLGIINGHFDIGFQSAMDGGGHGWHEQRVAVIFGPDFAAGWKAGMAKKIPTRATLPTEWS